MKSTYDKKSFIITLYILLIIVIIIAAMILTNSFGLEFREAEKNFDNFVRENRFVYNEEYILLKSIMNNANIEKNYNILVSLSVLLMVFMSGDILIKKESFRKNVFLETKEEFKMKITADIYSNLVLLSLILFYILLFSKELLLDYILEFRITFLVATLFRGTFKRRIIRNLKKDL